jgi:hypothetical protein
MESEGATLDFLNALEAEVARTPSDATAKTGVRCPTSTGPHRCPGYLYVKRMSGSSSARWHCAVCGREGEVPLDGEPTAH